MHGFDKLLGTQKQLSVCRYMYEQCKAKIIACNATGYQYAAMATENHATEGVPKQ